MKATIKMLVLSVLVGFIMAGFHTFGCYDHNNPPPTPHDPTCPKGSILCDGPPCPPHDIECELQRVKRHHDGGIDK